MSDNTLPTASTLDRRLRRLLRDLTAVGLMQAGSRLAAGERLNAVLGLELHQAICAQIDRPLPLPSPVSRRVA